MDKKEKHLSLNTKINVVILIYGFLMGILALPIISLFPSEGNLSFFQYMGYLLIYSIFVRITIYAFQKILIKITGNKYDDADGSDVDNRFKSNITYTATLLVALTLILHFANDEGWISSIIVGILLTIPAIFANILVSGEKIASYQTNDNKSSSSTKSSGLFSDYSSSGNFGNHNYYNKDGTLKGFSKKDNFGNTVYYDKNGSQNKDMAYSKKGNFGETIYYKKDGTISDDVAYSKKGNFGETIYYRKDGTIKGTSRKSNLGTEIYQEKK